MKEDRLGRVQLCSVYVCVCVCVCVCVVLRFNWTE